MGTNFDQKEIASLNKTNATKQAQVAVRDSQNAPRASYKPNACPSWWKAGQTVLLPSGSQGSMPDFGNPKELTLDELKVVLHCYYAFKLNTSVETLTIAGVQKSTDDDGRDSDSNSRAPEFEPFAPASSTTHSPPLKKKRKVRVKKAEEPVAAKKVDSKEEIHESESQTVVVDDLPIAIEDVKAQVNPRHRRKVCVSEELYNERLAYLEKLRSEYTAIENEFENVITKQRESTRRFVDDYRSNMNFTVTRLKTTYEVASVLPPEFLNMTMADIVEKYGLDLDAWLQATVVRGVEAAMGPVRVTNDSSEDEFRVDGADSQHFGNGPVLPCKTPPARTPAARRRRENIQDTVLRTARKVRMADNNDDVKLQQRSEATKAALASVLSGTGRITRSRAPEPSKVGPSATPAAAVRKARKGEVVITYSINGTPVRKSDGEGCEENAGPATPVTSKLNDDAGSRIQALLSMAEDIPKTIRQTADPEKHIAYLRRQLDEAEAELNRERG